ncbi:MAG: NlpC/P60 family protein [Pseudomonadota bacterium]
MTRDDLVAAARQCLGTPFRHQGRALGRGLDCVGLLIHVAHGVGLQTDDPCDYGRQPAHGLLERHLAAAGLAPIPPVAALPGDVLLFRIDGPAQHVALASDKGMIHAYALARRVVEHRLDPVWRARLVGAYRFPGVS